MSGVVIVSNQPQAAELAKEILGRYFPSQNEGHLSINNKYFSNDVTLTLATYHDLSTLSQQGQKIDCLILITSQGSQEHSIISKELNQILQKVDPVSQVLLINGDESQEIDLEKFYEESDCFIQSITVDLGKEIVENIKELPKSIVEDVDGVLRLVQIIDSTSWRSIKKGNKEAQNTGKVESKGEPAAPKEESKGGMGTGVNIYSQGVDQKLEKDMNHFATLMDQMLSLKGQSLPDSERKERAADLIMKLAMSMEDEQDEEFNDFE